MSDELNYEAFTRLEDKRQTQLMRLQELRNKARAVIFPCMIAQKDSAKTSDVSKYSEIKK